MGNYKDLVSYQKAYKLAMRIFEISKTFPMEERFSLTNQIRRSSRSVCANLAEAFRRKPYRRYFTSKINDCLTENSETEVWIEFAKDCKYLEQKDYLELLSLNNQVGKLLWFIANNPNKFLSPPKKTPTRTPNS